MVGVGLLKDSRCDDTLVPKSEAWSLQRSLELNPVAKTHYLLGYVYRDNKAITNNLNRAVQEFLAAVKMEPALAEFHSSLADAYRQEGNIEGALAEFETALNMDSNDIQTRYFFAMALLQKERLDDASKQLRQVVASDANYRDAAKVLRKIGEYRETQMRRTQYLRALRGY